MYLSAFFLVTLCCLLGGSSDVWAQGFGSVRGTVMDPDGTPIAGATFLVWELRRKATTDEQGRFLMHGVPVGIYNIHLSLPCLKGYFGVLVGSDRRVDLSFTQQRTGLTCNASVLSNHFLVRPTTSVFAAVNTVYVPDMRAFVRF